MVYLKFIFWLCVAFIAVSVVGSLVFYFGIFSFLALIFTDNTTYKILWGVALLVMGIGVLAFFKYLFQFLASMINPSKED